MTLFMQKEICLRDLSELEKKKFEIIHDPLNFAEEISKNVTYSPFFFLFFV
jgi:hypothetical protein